jgi:hypothetical protein
MTANSTETHAGDVSALARAGADVLVSAMPHAGWEQIEGSIVGLLAGEDSSARETALALLESDRAQMLDGRGVGVADRWCLFLLGHLDEHPESAPELDRIISASAG